MKSILALLCLGLISCAHTAVVTPRTDLAPIRTSNTATRVAIKSNKEHLEKAQEANKEGSDSLKDARITLEQLLNQ